MMKYLLSSALATVLAATSLSTGAHALEKVKVAVSFITSWDPGQIVACKARGDFEKAGLDVDVANTRGGSENLQAVIAGGMDIGYGVGTNSVLAAQMQGSPIKIISGEFLGQNDTFFYVPAASPLKSIDDIRGKSVAFPRPGGATEYTLLALNAERKLDLKPVPTGGTDATMTATMTRQVDVGYSVVPIGLDAVERGEIRILLSGDEVQSVRNITGRVIVARNDFLKDHRDTAIKFMRTLDGCIDWSYANPDAAAKNYAADNKIDIAIATKAMKFYKRGAVAFGPIIGIDEVVQQAVDGKFIKEKPSAAELKSMIDIIYTSPTK
jgi:NitT/TauT family transport system substrate-binding protein